MSKSMRNVIIAVVIAIVAVAAFVFITSHIHVYGIGFYKGMPNYRYSDTLLKQIANKTLGTEQVNCDWYTYTFKI